MGGKASGTTRKTTAEKSPAMASRSRSVSKSPPIQRRQTKRPGGRSRYTEKVVGEALTKSRGMIATAARSLDCHRQTVYEAMERWPALKEIVEQEREVFVDTAEFKLQQAVNESEAWAVCFTLKCLGKGRGYVERLDHRHSGPEGGPVEVTFRLAGD